jgi:hypothetical protein
VTEYREIDFQINNDLHTGWYRKSRATVEERLNETFQLLTL